MELLGTVGSEGGPFLFVDRVAFASWGGAGDGSQELGETDYGRVCDIHEGELPIGGFASTVFDIVGPGIASIFRAGPSELVIV